MIEEILNELDICDYTYDKQNGTIKTNEAVGFLSQELAKITSSLKEYKIIFTVDRNQNIRIEE